MRKLFLLLFATQSILIFSQGKSSIPIDPRMAAEKFILGNYKGALGDYLTLLKSEPNNAKYNIKVGECYLYTNIDKKKAIHYLEWASNLTKSEHDLPYLLGRAYHFSSRFDEAIEQFEKFKSVGKGTKTFLKDVDTQIQFCKNAKELIKTPLNVKFENMGKNINSPYPDYNPFIPNDESMLIFSSRRPGMGSVQNIDGIFTSTVYYSKIKDGSFAKSKAYGAPINSGSGDEEIVGLSADGSIMLLCFDNEQGFADLFFSTIDKSKNFRKVDAFDMTTINSEEYELAASISADGNTLFFSSNRPGGFGGFDLYYSKKLPSGTWGEAKNLGPVINSSYDEDFPNISASGKTLYFSSNNNKSMGGFDIFRTNLDEEKVEWQTPVNIGYPINTVEDNNNIRFSESGRYAYISALTDSGYGDLDIYRVIFKDIEPKTTILKGAITCIDTTRKIYYGDCFISIFDNISGEMLGNSIPNSTTGKYVLTVPPGHYTITVDLTGYNPFEYKLDILDAGTSASEIEKNIELIPIGYIPPQPIDKKGNTNKNQKK